MISSHLRPSDIVRLIAVGIAASGLAIAGCDKADDYESVTLDHETVEDDTLTSPGVDDPYAPDPAVEGALPGERGISDTPDYSQTPPGQTLPATEEERAVAVISATEGSDVQGEIRFTADMVADTMQITQITGQLSGLEPGEHGLHVHVNGDCSGENAEAAGGHFAPAGESAAQAAAPGEDVPTEAVPTEAAPTEAAPAEADEVSPGEIAPAGELQPGELGTVVANADGTATINLESEMTLARGPNGIIGRAIVIHFGKDDDPVACGVIQEEEQVATAQNETI